MSDYTPSMPNFPTPPMPDFGAQQVDGLFPFLVSIAPYLLTAFIVAVVFAGIILLLVMRSNRGGLKAKDKVRWDEETRMVQEMHDELTKMESRIETLETILMETYGKDKR